MLLKKAGIPAEAETEERTSISIDDFRHWLKDPEVRKVLRLKDDSKKDDSKKDDSKPKVGSDDESNTDGKAAGSLRVLSIHALQSGIKSSCSSRFASWLARTFYRLSDDAQRDHFADQVGTFAKHIVATLGANFLPSNIVDVLF